MPRHVIDDPRWLAVMEAAGHRCQCTSLHCPSHRGNYRSRCHVQHDPPAERLTVGHSHPGPDPMRHPEEGQDDLIAWCESCWRRAVSASAKQAQTYAQHKLTSATPTLF
jgi:hypothetical protein